MIQELRHSTLTPPTYPPGFDWSLHPYTACPAGTWLHVEYLYTVCQAVVQSTVSQSIQHSLEGISYYTAFPAETRSTPQRQSSRKLVGAP